eukprot:gnl/TRDRNA2_/TRDRNA2_171709_c0_seq10.p1 gnl/TRDRNA2_/TRDRNA2_171709_c0~~gnl/TRDRNA2_/TRDRNA2_171709_c0_seq10.p1  ORF type:complete len:453 (-),score=103.23 gnl/TRDRNA2_/TRDRNA2_171709_c0_seq10:62-1366(-)
MGRVVNGQSYRDRVKSSLKVEQQLGSQAQNARRPSASGEAAPAGGGSSPLQKRCFVPSTPSPMMRPSSFPEQGGGQVPNFSLGGSMLPPGYGEVAFGELGFGDVGFGDVSTPGFDAQMDQQMAPQCYFPTMAYDPSSGVYVPCGWMLVDCNEYDPMGQAQIIDNSCYDMPIKGVEQASPSPLLRMLTEDQNLMQTPLPEQEPQQQIDAEQWPLALEQGGQHSGQEASWEIEAAEQQQAQSRDSSYPQTQGQDDSRRRPKGRGKGRGREEKESASEELAPVKENVPCTTVMLRNIPNKYTREMLVSQLNQDMRGLFDFVYLPIDFKNKCNVGYAFINFRSVESCDLFVMRYNGVDVRKCLPGLNSKKVAEVTPARVQGFEENVWRLRNSPVMNELVHHPEWMPLLLDEQGEEKPFPAPAQPLAALKLRRRQTHAD